MRSFNNATRALSQGGEGVSRDVSSWLLLKEFQSALLDTWLGPTENAHSKNETDRANPSHGTVTIYVLWQPKQCQRPRVLGIGPRGSLKREPMTYQTTGKF